MIHHKLHIRMAHKHIFYCLLTLALLGTSCSDPYNDVKEKDIDYVTGDNDRPETELDTWIRTTFTETYNIQVKYRWDNSELDPYKTLTPPDVTKVRNVMDVVKRVWIDTYNQVADADFMKEYCPKQFLLVGSANYNQDGSRTIGTAEGGRKVVLFVVNEFKADDREEVKNLMHTVEHEFGHILNQTINYPAEFKEVSKGGYTANWATIPTAEARLRGFITSYSMLSANEDFVEMVATMLIEGKEGYERILACQTSPASRALIRRKEQLVKDYFQEKFNIDFTTLQTRVQEALEALAPATPEPGRPPVLDVWGYGKDSVALDFDFARYSYPPGFLNAFRLDDNAVAKQKGYQLQYYFRLVFTDETHVQLQRYYIYTPPGGTRELFLATYTFELVQQENGAYAFYYDYSPNEAGQWLLDHEAHYLVDYFINNQFRIEWERTTCPGSGWVGLYPANEPNDGYTFGILAN
jgi:substrate import-associated zinc metallohydrolase lipoprotein